MTGVKIRSVLLLALAMSLVASMIGVPGWADPGAVDEPPASFEVNEEDGPYDVLFFHLTTGFRHGSIEAAITAVEEIGEDNGFSVEATQDPSVFNDADLRQYAAVVFFTDGEDTLNHEQRTAFERYIHRGGGFVGLHSTTNMDNQGWPWWEELLGGAFFTSHPPIQDGVLEIEDSSHPATAHFDGATFEWPDDEWYNFAANPRDAGVHVLLTVDTDSFNGSQMGDDHPIAWCEPFDGGRTFYTAIGHSDFHYDIPEFRQHLLGGIEWAAGVAEGDCGEPREAAPTDASFEKVELHGDTVNPMMMDIAEDGRVFFTELAGTLKVWNPTTGTTTVAGELDVYRDHENGLLGIQLDPDFSDNGWIYLYHSHPVDNVQHLSRFDFNHATQTLNVSSQRLLLEVPHQRDECCHSAGDLEFDSDGNLYLSTGDDTNPFGSQNFGPFDFREGRDAWDAARSSGNTADLRGKVLRIKPLDDPGDTPGPGSTYEIPEGNLFTDGAYDHLFPDGTYDPELGRPEIFVMGLRNPFKLSIDPETDWLYVGDVGHDANPSGGHDPNRGPRGYDSWNQVREAANFGWPFCYQYDEPFREWDFATGEAGDWYDCINGAINESPRNTGLEQLPPARSRTVWYPYCNNQGNYTAPVPFPEIPCGNVPGGHNYGTGRASFMGDIYRMDPDVTDEGAFPAFYDGKPFVLEWERDIIGTLTLDDEGEYVDGSFEEFMPRVRYDDAQRFRKPHDLQFGPDGHLYLIEWGDDFNFAGGAVNPDSGLYRISYVKGGRSPLAHAAATPDAGIAPLAVTFSSAASEDLDGGELTYAWEFGDGQSSTEANPTHTYAEDGVYEARLTVTSDTGRTGTDTIVITVGNTRPEVTISAPADGRVFSWGEQIPYEVAVSDIEDGSTAGGDIACEDVTVVAGLSVAGALDEPAVEWISQSGCEGSFTTDIGDFGPGDDITAVVTASYTDGGGGIGEPLTGQATHRLQPQRKQAQFFTDSSDVTTDPSGDSECCGDAVTGSDGAWVAYDPFNLQGIEQVTLRAASQESATVELRSGAPDGELIGTADVQSTTSFPRVEGQDGFGSAVQLNGGSPNAYVEMPEGILSDLDGDFTIATWVDRGQLGQQWSRIWDFGSGTGTFLFLTPNASGDPSGMRVDFNQGSGSQFIPAAGSPGTQLPTGWQHVALTLSGNTATLWLNGEQYAVNTNVTNRASNMGQTTQNWIGRSQFSADPLINAAIDDFQIFDYALDGGEVASLLDSPGGSVGGGNVAWYTFEETGGPTVLDSSGNEQHAQIVQSEGASSYADITIDIDAAPGSAPLYVVFPDNEVRLNYLHLGEPEDPVEPGPELPACVAIEIDDFDGDALGDHWTVVEHDAENLTVADGRLSIQTVAGRDFFAGDGTLPNVVVREMPSGAWTATVEMEFSPAQNFQNGGFVLWDDEDNYVKAGLVHADQLSFEMIKELDGVADFSPGNVPASGDFPDAYQLRISADADGVVTAEFSTDGDDWTLIGTSDLSGLEASGIGLYATNSTSTAATNPAVAHFDAFTLEHAGGAGTTTVSDEFEAAALDGCRWDRTVRYDADALRVEDGSLHVDTSPLDIFGDNNTDPTNLVLQDAPEGDWVIETRMHAPLERNFQNAGFLLHEDDDNYLKAGVVALNQPGDARELAFEMATEVDGEVQFPLVNDAVPDHDNDDWWLRLSKEGDSYTVEWSVDGEEFTPLSEPRTIVLDDPAVGLYAVGTEQQVDPVTISWDYFRLLGEVEGLTASAVLDPADPDGDNGWWVSPVELLLSANDPDADLAYRPAGTGEWIDYDGPVTFTDDGTYDLEYRATVGDPNGDGDPDPFNVAMDGFAFVPDEVTLAQGQQIIYEYVSGPPHNVVTVDADGNEIDHSGDPFSEGTYEFTPQQAGQFYVYCEPHSSRSDPDPANWTGMVIDLTVTAGGDFASSEIGEVSFQIDQTPAETDATVVGEAEGEGYVGEVTVTLDAQDATSGVAQTDWRLDGDEEHQTYDGPLSFEEPGTYVVEYRSVDVAGNVEDWQSTTFEIVEDAPPGGEIALELTASTRCIAGNVFVVVTARNDNQTPVEVEFLSDFGTRMFTGVVPDRFASHAFNSRATSLTDGSVTVEANAEIDGVEVTDTWTVAFDGTTCTQ